jgi:C1A family cysteine protease
MRTRLKPRPKPKQPHSYGWVRDLPDHRDRKYSLRAPSIEAQSLPWWQSVLIWLHILKPPTPPPGPPLPASVDLRPTCPPIVDQGNLGSCTANALAGALGFLEVKDDLAPKPFSRLYIYYDERVIEGTVGTDAGAEIRDGIKTLAQGQQGACYETTWPYDIGKFTVEPPPQAYAEGEAHEILVYERLDNTQIAQLKDCLASGFPFVFGFTVYASFESQTVAQTGVVPMPGLVDFPVGGHAVVCVGYDDSTQRFLCRNSWGTGWGMQGYFTIPYAYLTNPGLASDFWTISRGELMVRR